MSIRIVALCGSLRTPSATRHALEFTLRGAASAGASVELLDLAELELPFCDGRDDADTYPEEVQQFRAILQSSHGVILGTPEYHNSMTGALKNAIDLCGMREFEHKMVGLVGLAGGAIGAINAINHLRTVMRSVGAWVLPHQVSISHSNKVIDDAGEVLDGAIAVRLEKLGVEVAKFSRLMAAGIINPASLEDE